jgi:hypothetical protein
MWRRGYMSEAVNVMLRFIFEVQLKESAYASCAAANRASAGVLEQAGMKLVERCIAMNTLTSRKNTFATGWNEASGVCRKAPQPCMFNYAVRLSEVRCARAVWYLRLSAEP